MSAPRLPPDHKIPNLNGHTLGDFWSWAYSEVLTNTTRSVFAEYLVGAALGVVETPRVEWDRQDFEYRGRGIEVVIKMVTRAVRKDILLRDNGWNNE